MSKLADLGALGGPDTLAFSGLALALTLLIAAASFYGIERHALRLGRRLSHRRRSQDADVRMRDLPQHERPEPGVP
jgi:peptidoglycan/LPS O-acetylase OafA/YrhL